MRKNIQAKRSTRSTRPGHRTSDKDLAAFLLKVLHNVVRAASSKKWDKKGRIIVPASIVIARQAGPEGGQSGCFIFNVCTEDETTLTSHCEVMEVCGEFPPIE